MDSTSRPYAPISDYALIGDCHSTALVRRNGSIDWACLQRFDRGAVFCRLLDAERGGSFDIAARKPQSIERRYLPDTNVLETRFTTASGTARLLDCFTMRPGGSKKPYRQLLRVIEGVDGTVNLDINIQPRFDYGALRPWLRYHEHHDVYSAVGGDDAMLISTDCPLSVDRDEVALRTTVSVTKGDRCRLSLVACAPHEMDFERLSPEVLDRRLKATLAWWRRWVRRGHYPAGEFSEAVKRSSLALKLLTCAPTGAIVAAATTSLPELPGGGRNWDYRYCWIRDSTLTLAAMLSVGRPEVATGFKLFIERATAGSADDLQIMYGCYGERRLVELELDHLSGYRDSRPVRIGNGAASQLQLDVYGELLDAAHLWRRGGSGVSEDGWRFLRSLVNAVCTNWRQPDRGMWESRGPAQHFVYSKVMCWLALERGIQTAEETSLPADLARWRAERDECRQSIEQQGVDPDRGCFVQAYGSRELDASLLRLPIVGFVDANDPRMIATVKAVREDLAHGRLLSRYRTASTDDGVSGEEGAFLMVSFWLVDVLTMQGEVDDAESLFRYLVSLCNDVGLYAEEYDPRSSEFLGNFPQAFTHVALISAAQQLARIREGDHHRLSLTERPAPAAAQRPRGKTLHHDHRSG